GGYPQRDASLVYAGCTARTGASPVRAAGGAGAGSASGGGDRAVRRRYAGNAYQRWAGHVLAGSARERGRGRPLIQRRGQWESGTVGSILRSVAIVDEALCYSWRR